MPDILLRDSDSVILTFLTGMTGLPAARHLSEADLG